MWIQGLQAITLAVTARDRWSGAGSSLRGGSHTEWLLTAFAIVALALAVVLLFWVAVKRRRTEDNLKQNITDLTVTTFKLRKERDDLAAANKELQQAIAELSRRQAAVPESAKSR